MGYPQNPAPGYGTPNYPPAQPGYSQPPPPPQPSYGQPSYNQPPGWGQQGYGQQAPPPAAPPQRFTGDDFLGQPAGGSGKSIAKWIGSMPPGTALTGIIPRAINPATDVQLQTVPNTNPPVPVPPYKDGTPKKNLTIPLQLVEPYPHEVFQDGRACWIVTIKDYRDEVLPAMEAAGVTRNDEGNMPFPEAGARMTITFAGDKQVPGPSGLVNKKQKHCTYTRPQDANQAPPDGQTAPAPAAGNPYSAPQQPQYTQPAPTWQQPQPQYTQPAPAPQYQQQPSAQQYPQQGPLPTQAGAPPYQGVPPQPMQQPPAPAANGPQPVPETATDLFDRLKQGQQQAPPQG